MQASTFLFEVRHQVNRFLGAVVFLTRIPVGRLYTFRAEELPRSAVYFPLVGLLVGLLAGLVLLGAQLVLPSIVAILLCMVTTILVTGALHEDGLADAADGLGGGTTPERRLAIMKESVIGVYGAVVLWFSLTAKLLLLGSLLEKGAALAFAALVVANGMGRAGAVALLFACPYVRQEESKASPFASGPTFKEFVLSLLPPVLLAILFLRQEALVILGGVAATVWASSVLFRRMVGGITGDCLGAANQVIELICYLLLTVRFAPIGR